MCLGRAGGGGGGCDEGEYYVGGGEEGDKSILVYSLHVCIYSSALSIIC